MTDLTAGPDTTGPVDPPAASSTDATAEDSKYSGYRVHVGDFDGPLDLLLHLVRANEVDITDIPIVTITEQYNATLDLMRELNLEIAGEYLVMAATLMHIKSRMLLPPDPEALEDGEAADPRAELAQQLLEYQRFKQAAETLQALDSRQNLIWTRDQIHADFEGEELLAVDMFDLMKAFRGLLGRLGDEARLAIRRDHVSVADKIHWLSELLETRNSLELLPLMADLPDTLERIATFLAVLEMVKLQMILVFQRKAIGEIRIARIQEAPAGAAGATTQDAAAESRLEETLEGEE